MVDNPKSRTSLRDWRSYWNRMPSGLGEKEFFRQIGKTVNGSPITEAQFDILTRELRGNLSLEPEDLVLDLCCGNGIITRSIAKHCRRIVGVDFSAPLIAIAKKHNQTANVRYLLSSVLDLNPEMVSMDGVEKVGKVYMYEALQHFEVEDLARLLNRLMPLLSQHATVCLASVPDQSCLWDFYNTPERREEYHRRVAEGTEAIGTWWERRQLEDIARDSGFQVRFARQNPKLHTAHYRFDVVLNR